MEAALLLLIFLCVIKNFIYASQFDFNSNIKHFSVEKEKIYVATESRIFQMRHDLLLEKSKNISSGSHPNSVSILLPFESNGTLVMCGTSGCGYCEILNISDITQTIYSEKFSLIPQNNESSVVFLVNFSGGSYMLVGREKSKTRLDEHKQECINQDSVTLHNTLHSQSGDIFSYSSLGQHSLNIDNGYEVEWIDGFQASSGHHSYLFGNIWSQRQQPKAFLLKLDNNIKKDLMLRSTKGAVLRCCEDKTRSKLISSAVISSDPSLIWTGIFTAQDPEHPENTAVVIYKIQQEKLKEVVTKINSTLCKDQPCVQTQHAVVFKHNSLTAIAAEQRGTLTVLYIGTANGQLMKLVLKEDFSPVCFTVLYKSDDDRKVFPKMLLHPNHNSIYIVLENQLMRLPVMQCDKYSTLSDCIKSKDLFCGWCVVTNKCAAHNQCSNSTWISIPVESSQNDLLSFEVSKLSDTINLSLQLNLNISESQNYTCDVMTGSKTLCTNSTGRQDKFLCSCRIPIHLPTPNVTVRFSIGAQTLTETLTLRNCSDMNYKSPYAGCVACALAGCHWITSSKNCSWAPESPSHINMQEMCRNVSSDVTYMPEISSIEPKDVSFHGKKNVVIKGKNLEHVKKIRFHSNQSCSMTEVPVLQRSNNSLTFTIPSGNKGRVKVCVVTEDDVCHGNAYVSYFSLPRCTELQPNVSWSSGHRKVKLLGNDMWFVDDVIVHSPSPKKSSLISNNKMFGWFFTLAQGEATSHKPYSISLSIGDSSLVPCTGSLTYHPDPEFQHFTLQKEFGELMVTIQKKEDLLNMISGDLNISGYQKETRYECVVDKITPSTVLCRIANDIKLDLIKVIYGNITVEVNMATNHVYLYMIILFILIILGALIGVYIIRKNKQKLSAQMDERVELIETQIRNEIRQGFVDLQTEKSDLAENIGAIPYLDYKHFALKIFFPEGSTLATSVIKDVGQDVANTEMDEKSQAFAALIRNQTFLTCFVHALEEQKNFSIKDKCIVASLLTVALHRDLTYLTHMMEELLQNLMDQPSNAQPKLLLRRTESIVEKMLTNWMSVCLYGFLRESVGQHLFLLVSALSQQISRGPVDAVTGKALYTLNEDWLLWQAQDFSPLKLKVLFAVGTGGEVSEPLEVNVLTCDTVEQVKEKILQTFQRKFGFPYTQQLGEIDIEYEKEGSYKLLEEVDGSSEVQGNVTMLNTLTHFNTQDGAYIKVITKTLHAPLRKQTSLRDDQNFCTKYFHLIDPDDDLNHSNHPERKKLKLKEIYLTKLLSTKVAVHSFVENLFQSIWGMPNNRAPSAVKYFFDFLDDQAEKKKITDPDVLHIWKTNSVPLRFWVNILKNPNFVFSDLEKTPHLDACLSVIAQAFMDSFSLTDHQLGKHSPTNKLLYAKDIPRYKQEVKSYYKLVSDQASVSSKEFKIFLEEESKKHDSEFKESAALQELYRYMQRYYSEIDQKLEEQEEASSLKEKMNNVKQLYESRSKTTWD